MKKYIVSFAAVVALAIAPASALAGVSPFGGYGTPHDDNLGNPTYLTHFGSSGSGDSHYCVNPPPAADNSCAGAPINPANQSTGYLDTPVACVGCGHGPHSTGGALFISVLGIPVVGEQVHP
jgi:hypothetical protein